MGSQIASHETRLPAIPPARSRRVLEIALLVLVVIGYGASMYDDTPLVVVLFSAILLAIGTFLYKAGKRSESFSQAAGREMPSSATGDGRRRHTVDLALIALIAAVLLALQIQAVIEGSAYIGGLLWTAFFFAMGRIVYVAGKRSVQSGHRQIGDATKILAG